MTNTIFQDALELIDLLDSDEISRLDIEISAIRKKKIKEESDMLSTDAKQLTQFQYAFVQEIKGVNCSQRYRIQHLAVMPQMTPRVYGHGTTPA